MDLISRQAAIDLVRDVCNAILNECSCHYDSEAKDDVYDDIHEVDTILKCNKAIRKSLMDLPSAQPEQRWINVDERLPNDGDRVIVQMLNGHICIIEFSAWGVTNHLAAWMPLPELYRRQPTIEERKKGKWEITEAYPHNVYCSECLHKFAQTHWAVWEDGTLPRNYCPNCGSYNGGGDDEQAD